MARSRHSCDCCAREQVSQLLQRESGDLAQEVPGTQKYVQTVPSTRRSLLFWISAGAAGHPGPSLIRPSLSLRMLTCSRRSGSADSLTPTICLTAWVKTFFTAVSSGICSATSLCLATYTSTAYAAVGFTLEEQCACRRLGLARKLMQLLEDITVKMHNGYFVDLFVRKSNASAIAMYGKVC